MIRRLQPDIILNNRLVPVPESPNESKPFTGYGDFLTPEQNIPEKKITDSYGNDIPWETCLTLNNSWGFTSADNQWKSPDMIIKSLVNCVSKNGNLLLNIGPDAQGAIPEEAVKILGKVGEWTAVNGESIYGCSDFNYPKPEWGFYTRHADTVYAHITNPPVSHLNLRELGSRIKTITVIPTHEKGATATTWFGNSKAGNFFVNIKSPTYLTYIMPDNTDTVLKFEMKN
jgi:alpha-L-fucosidase